MDKESPEIEVIDLTKQTSSVPMADRVMSVLAGPLFLLWMVFIFLYGVFQVYAGYLGIQDGLGTWVAVAAVAAAFLFKFSLPITIGSFFGAMNVWGWHWFFAALFAAPGLFFIIPGVVAAIMGAMSRRSPRSF